MNEDNIIKEVIIHKYKNNEIKNRYDVLKNYLSTANNKLVNKHEIKRAIKNINYEMEESIKEFRKMFDYDI